MRRILLSAAMIIGVAGLVAGATGAFYNDTETTSGNLLTSGALDLKVDHEWAIYNGSECENACQADTDTNLLANGGFETPEVQTSQGWNIYADGTTGLGWNVEWMPGANAYQGNQRPETAFLELHRGALGDASEGEQYTELDADWDGPGGSINGEPARVRIYQDISTTPGETYELRFAHSPRPNTSNGQNEMKVTAGGDHIANIGGGGGGANVNWTEYTYQFTADSATTRIQFEALGPGDSEGVFLDDVRVHPVECEQTFERGSCNLWSLKNLTEEQFFVLDDVKPGDNGQHYISLHLDDNPGWACLRFENGDDQENSLTEVEEEAGDTTQPQGELRESVEAVGWRDKDGNHTFDSGNGEEFTDVVTLADIEDGRAQLPIADSVYENEPVVASSTAYYNLFWCVGDIATTSSGATCDGAGAHNNAQTDSLTADVTIYTEQERNNDNFVCGAPDTLDI